VSIYAFHADYPASRYNGTRLSPIGRAGNPILGGLLYGSAGIVALYCAKQAKTGIAKLGYLAIAVIVGYLIVLTQSRMPLAVYTVCVCLGAWLYSGSCKRLLLFGIVALGMIELLIYLTPVLQNSIADYLVQCLARKDGYRLEMWSQTVEGITEHPWLGSGLGTRLIAPAGAPGAFNPHNLYLATAFYLGIPCAALFLCLVTWCIYLAIGLVRAGTPIGILAGLLLLHGVLSGMTDHAQLVKAPSPLWFIFWLPMGFVIARTLPTVADRPRR
jgi:O-antigen ligase